MHGLCGNLCFPVYKRGLVFSGAKSTALHTSCAPAACRLLVFATLVHPESLHVHCIINWYAASCFVLSNTTSLHVMIKFTVSLGHSTIYQIIVLLEVQSPVCCSVTLATLNRHWTNHDPLLQTCHYW